VTVLHNLARVVKRTASAETLAAVEEGRWPLDTAPTLLQSARLAKKIANTLDHSTTGAEEQAHDVVLALAPVLRPMARGATVTVEGKQKVRPARIPTCDTIADLLEWARLKLPNLATDVDGPLAPHVEYLLWKASRSYTAATDREETLHKILDMMAELQEACEREAAPRVTVAGREYLLLWKPEDSPEARSLERLLAAAFQPGGIEREAAGRAILAQFMLLSPRLLSIGWHRIRAAAAAASSGGDEEEARRSGRAFGTVLRQARDEAEQRAAVRKQARDEAARSAIEPATDVPGVDAATESLPGSAERRRPARRDTVGAPADTDRRNGPQRRANPIARGTGSRGLECAGGGRAGRAARGSEAAGRGEAAARGTEGGGRRVVAGGVARSRDRPRQSPTDSTARLGGAGTDAVPGGTARRAYATDDGAAVSTWPPQ